jgi:hypothetical protein
MSLLDRSNKENLNSVMEGVADEYSNKFKAFDKSNNPIRMTGIEYRDGEFNIITNDQIDSISFRSSVINDMYHDIHKKVNINSESDLRITADQSVVIENEIRTTKNISISPSMLYSSGDFLISISNINIFAKELSICPTFIKLYDSNIKVNTLTLSNIQDIKDLNNITGHIESGRLDIYTANYIAWENFFKVFEDKEQVIKLSKYNLIQAIGLGSYISNSYRIVDFDKTVIITRDPVVYRQLKKYDSEIKRTTTHSYLLDLNGDWHLLYVSDFYKL